MTDTTPTPESVALFYKEGSSDKEYRVELRDMGDGTWMTLGFNGRRGGTLKEQKKTPTPVDFATAKKKYDAIVREKTKEGYTTDASGSIYQSLPGERTFSGFVPQLLNVIRSEADLEALILDSAWWAQEKHDGERRPFRVTEGVVEGINKEGLATSVPMNLVEDLRSLGANVLLDGEALGERYVAFDLLECNGQSLREMPYDKRLEQLEALLAGRAFSGMELVHTARTAQEKRALLTALRDHGAEGAAFKRHDAAYAPGRPASGGSQIKYKFTETCSVRVASRHATKRSVAVEGLGADGRAVALGSVTIPINADIPAVGAIVNVGYLYWYAGGSLYQPTFQGVRTDQSAPDPISALKTKSEAAFRADQAEDGAAAAGSVEAVGAAAPTRKPKRPG